MDTSERVTRGGYDCEFVESPPRMVQTECSLCLLVLREPHITSCCGHSYCGACITEVKSSSMSCPLCNEPEYTLMHNKGLERSLKELEVHCSNERLGCPWTGNLGELEKHLNIKPEPHKEQEGCEFVEFECIHDCGERFKRCRLPQHQSDECLKRPYSCDYCHDYESTFEDVVSSHYSVCPHYLVPCPNQCSPYTFERQDLPSHLAKDCLLQITPCTFAYAGCEVALPRKNLPSHLEDSCVSHLSLLAALNLKLTHELEERDKNYRELKEEMLNEIGGLRLENEKLSHKVDSLGQEIERYRSEVERYHSKVEDYRGEVESLYHQCNTVPVEVVMTEFTKHKETDKPWFSDPFYSHTNGYKMCLKVDASGCGPAKTTHLSIFVHLMQGEFDDHLKWPFLGDITVQLLNQFEESKHCVETISFTETTPAESSHRVKGTRGLGWTRRYKFIGHDELIDMPNRICYLSNDTLHIRILRVKLK